MTTHVQDGYPNLVLIGPPGAGKSTIAKLLTQQVPLTIVATGKRLRAEVANATPIGLEIKPLVEQGHFAPDALINRLVRDWLARVPPDHGFLLDGYPRSISQATALGAILSDLNRRLDLVIALELSTAEAVRRLSGRRICQEGGEPFTLHISDAAAVRQCKERGGRLIQREDDQPEVINERFRVYTQETQPLLDFYAQQGVLHTVDAHGSPEEVTARVLLLLRHEV